MDVFSASQRQYEMKSSFQIIRLLNPNFHHFCQSDVTTFGIKEMNFNNIIKDITNDLLKNIEILRSNSLIDFMSYHWKATKRKLSQK